MSNHIKLAHMPGVHCHMRPSSTSGCAFVYFIAQYCCEQQEELTNEDLIELEEGEKVGDGRAEGSSTIGDGGQSQISLMPHADGTGSASLLDSIPSTLLKKQSSDVQVLALFFSHHR